MGTAGQLKEVEDQLIKELKETTVSSLRLAKKYKVSKQAIFQFIQRKEIKRPKSEHTEKCRICQRLLRISKKPHSDFISSRTIKGKIRVGGATLNYHLRILRKKELISQKFGRLQSKKLERAYQIYFKRRLPISEIGRQAGLENFRAVIGQHRASGWDVPAPLFKYDGNARRESKLKMIRGKIDERYSGGLMKNDLSPHRKTTNGLSSVNLMIPRVVVLSTEKFNDVDKTVWGRKY